MSTSSIKRQIRRFHVVVVQCSRAKKCTKKRDAVQSCCLAHKTNCFLKSSLWSSSSLPLLKLQVGFLMNFFFCPHFALLGTLYVLSYI